MRNCSSPPLCRAPERRALLQGRATQVFCTLYHTKEYHGATAAQQIVTCCSRVLSYTLTTSGSGTTVSRTTSIWGCTSSGCVSSAPSPFLRDTRHPSLCAGLLKKKTRAYPPQPHPAIQFRFHWDPREYALLNCEMSSSSMVIPEGTYVR